MLFLPSRTGCCSRAAECCPRGGGESCSHERGSGRAAGGGNARPRVVDDWSVRVGQRAEHSPWWWRVRCRSRHGPVGRPAAVPPLSRCVAAVGSSANGTAGGQMAQQEGTAAGGGGALTAATSAHTWTSSDWQGRSTRRSAPPLPPASRRELSRSGPGFSSRR